jgi:uncharacterized protein (TIGR00369 family)
VESTPPVWQEPVRGGYPDPRIYALSGREQVDVFVRGAAPVPPLSRLLGCVPTAVSDKHCTFTMPVTGWLLGSHGVVPGGLLATLADGAFGLAIQTQIGPATRYATAELSMTFLRPVTTGSHLLSATGTAIHVGRTLALADVSIADDQERLIAHGTSRCSVFPPAATDPGTHRDEPPAQPTVTTQSPDPYLRDPEGVVLPDAIWAERSGLAIMRALVSGDLPAPPIHRMTGMTPTVAEPGHCTFALPATEWLNSPAARLQGGVTAWLAETAMSGAVQTVAPAGTDVTAVDMKVNFLRPIASDGGRLIARGTVGHRGRTLAIATAEVLDSAGRIAAVATGSSMLLGRRRSGVSDG